MGFSTKIRPQRLGNLLAILGAIKIRDRVLQPPVQTIFQPRLTSLYNKLYHMFTPPRKAHPIVESKVQDPS